jgi:pyridoxamine 5'-phosphate oxidase
MDPMELFRRWFRDAARAGTKLPEAMALLRGLGRQGLEFFTNYNSRKAIELASNPRAAVVFHWPLVERQVRIEGRIRMLTRKESDKYFQTRPRESRLSAWISPQSQEIPDREFLEREFDRARRLYGRKPIPRPQFWGGFRLTPTQIEFWHGRPYRLHDRLCYLKTRDSWRVVRLAP